jgi:homoserine O-acetyltransferase
MTVRKRLLLVALMLACARSSQAQYPSPTEGTFVLKGFQFRSGETLSELRLHYRTVGRPERDAEGVVRNAVLIMHGTGGSGAQFIRPEFAGELFGPHGLLDASRYYIILPDGIGHGQSSKPSDGLHARFPRYGYLDMVEAQYRLLTEGLGINHLRLVMGTSMGGMHMSFLMGSSSVLRQRELSTLATTDAALEFFVVGSLVTADANDELYRIEASRDYDPGPELEKIRAPLLAVNSADDLINPPELGILEREITRVPQGRAVVIPLSPATRGHGTHTIAVVWKRYLEELLTLSAR